MQCESVQEFDLHVSNKKVVYDIIHDTEKQHIFEVGVLGGILCFTCWVSCFIFWICVYFKTHKVKLKYEIIQEGDEERDTQLAQIRMEEHKQ